MVDLWPGLPVGWTVSCSKCLLKWGVAVVMVALQTGCQTSVPSRPVMTEEEAKRSIPRGERILNRLAEDNRVLEKEFVALDFLRLGDYVEGYSHDKCGQECTCVYVF